MSMYMDQINRMAAKRATLFLHIILQQACSVSARVYLSAQSIPDW
jgi:hypothetical protein